ncbi:hypothetical protein V500_04262 [Pseudogymnoascus sp. VKM F-4518 (FW-2643)]|nr:hypothetical protein V500_04262 [Pseudogymnoascus sp. VKM F-4518 (FW-2643)]
MSQYYTVMTALLAVSLLASHSLAATWPWSSDDFSTQIVFRDGCKASHYTAYETYDKPIDFRTSPLDHFNGPKLNPMNRTAGEQWEFDGIGSNAKTGLVIGFYRDPNYAILGTGNFRVSLDILWENGTIYSQDHHVAHSVVEECNQQIIGTWSSPGVLYSFEVSNDNRHAIIRVDTPTIKGSFEIESSAPARYPDGSIFPNEEGTTAAAPFFHWVQPIPTGRINVDLSIEGSPYVWTGLGGHERLWSAFSWFTVLEGMNVVRAEVGPYQLTYLAFKSHILTPGVAYPSVFLSKNGEPIFTATTGYVSKSENYVTLSKKYGGKVTGGLGDRSTGHVLNLVSPKTGKHWYFDFEHNAVSFEFALGEGSGGTGFAALATGGEIEGEKYQSVALVEQLLFPRDSPFFKSNYVE